MAATALAFTAFSCLSTTSLSAQWLASALVIGFCGALSTVSTFIVEVRLCTSDE